MTLLSPNHNYAADECIAQIPQHHIPTAEEKVKASENFDKSVLVAAHMAALHDAYIMEMATHPVNKVTIKPSSPTSSVAGLKPSMLKQLKIGKVHRKRVLHGTLCVKTLCTKTSHDGTMVVNVFEDEEGNATPIHLTDAMEGNGGSAQAQRMYPQGSKIAIKEPYLTRLPDGEVVLLVEKTTDLVFLWVPDYVEENGKVNGGDVHHENGMSGGRDSFAMEKKDLKGNGGMISDDGVTVERERQSSSASRELKFDDISAMKGLAKDETNGEQVEPPIGGVDESSRQLNLEDIEAMSNKGKGAGMEKGEEDDVNGKEDSRDQATSPEEDDAPSLGIEGETTEIAVEMEPTGEEAVVKDVGNVVPDGVDEEEATDAENVDARQTVESRAVDVDFGETVESRAVDVDFGETAAILRAKGNALLARGESDKAASMYTRALEKARADGQKVEEVLCSSNRAEVWLRLCRNQAALDDAEAALTILQDNALSLGAGDLAVAKALFRKGRALMGLHKYEDALRVLQEVLGKAPPDRQLREAAVKCRDRLKQALKPGKRQRAAAKRKKSAAAAAQ